jgi:hypothetical protein
LEQCLSLISFWLSLSLKMYVHYFLDWCEPLCTLRLVESKPYKYIIFFTDWALEIMYTSFVWVWSSYICMYITFWLNLRLVYISVWLSIILICTLFFVEFDLYLYVHFFLFNSKYCTCIYTCLFTFFQKRLQKELTALMKDPPIGVKVDAESIYKDLSE